MNMPESDSMLSYKSLERHLRYLRAAGFFRLDENTPKNQRILQTVYMRSVLIFFLVYTTQQILKIYEVRSNVDHVMGTMFLLLTNTDCIMKALVLWKKADQIQDVLNVMKGRIFNQGNPEHRPLLKETIQKSILLFRIFNYMSLFTCFLWVLHPTILHYRKQRIEFPVWFPFDPNSDPRYYATVIYVWLQTSWLAYCNTTTDIFITFSFEQCRTQISILRLDLESLIETCKKEAIHSTNSFTHILNKQFNKLLIHHKEILKTTDKIQDIFGGAVFYQFLVSGWIFCSSVYRMVNMDPASVEFISMIMYIICILIQVFLYCYYGNKIADESEKLTTSAYAMDWLEMSIPQRRSMFIFMERIKRPIQPMAGMLIPLSNATFVSIVRSSYSFYAFLKNSEH